MLYVIVVLFLLALPLTRFIIFNLPRILFGLIPDTYRYIRYRRWRECPSYGRIIAYTGLFGQGKTKECVRFITNQYYKYNGLMVYDDQARKWVQQNIVVYSNVELTIPFVHLDSLQQLVDCQNTPYGTVNLFLIDEASVVFNSREFKSNFSTPALNTILTSRHHKIGIFLTSQRFGHMDALLRQVTSQVFECRYFKPLRIQQIKVFDAWEAENCSNLLLIKPLRILYHYTSNRDYANYDTYAMVGSISKKIGDGDFVSDDQVISRRAAGDSDLRSVSRPRRKLKSRY